MKPITKLIGLLAIVLSLSFQNLSAQTEYKMQWPGFRGPYGCGFIENTTAPTKWSIDQKHQTQPVFLTQFKRISPGRDSVLHNFINQIMSY